MSHQMPRQVVIDALKQAREAESYIKGKMETDLSVEELLYALEQLGDIQEAILNLEEVLDIQS